MNFERLHAISILFFGFCNPYKVLELFDMTQELVFGVKSVKSYEIQGVEFTTVTHFDQKWCSRVGPTLIFMLRAKWCSRVGATLIFTQDLRIL